ncbi:class I SAM-dependent methyltransferase [Polynucleobacter sp. MWH-UH19D]|uniref:class I SAM-dependent methyltransferase n=1 Tax=Polynucleobacter sp. MWH-UH19D TaxID=1855610 RepID=UPI0033651DC4
MIKKNGWDNYSIWEHSSIVKELYKKRCRQEIPEMTCHAQAIELLRPHIVDGDSVLDVGCGSGYFFHSLVSRKISVEYWGIDSSCSLIDIGREELGKFQLQPDKLQNIRIEDVDGTFDHIICINVLSNIDNYHKPLERMLKMSKKTVLLRESIKDKSEYAYVHDRYLDCGVSLNVHVNHYGQNEILEFIGRYGYEAQIVTDLRTGGNSEMVIDHPHYWKFILAKRR